MDLDFFKKQIEDIKQTKLDAERIEKKEYEQIYKQAVSGLKELIEKLNPYIEYAKKEFNLSDHVKEIENVAPYAYTATIRWNKKFEEAHFTFTGTGTSFSFSLNDIINKSTIFSKHQLILIKNAFTPKNLDCFVESLLKKLEHNNIYIGNQY